MRLMFVAFALAGAALVILAATLGYDRYEFLRDGVRTSGRVVAYFENKSGTVVVGEPVIGGGRSFFPVIEFEVPGGKPVRFTAGVGGSTPRFESGSAVEVFYAPERPDEARIAELEDIWGMTITAAVFGVMLLMLGGLGYWFVRNDDR